MRARFVLPAVAAAAFLLFHPSPPAAAGAVCVVVAVHLPPSEPRGAAPDCVEVPLPTFCHDDFVGEPTLGGLSVTVCVPF